MPGRSLKQRHQTHRSSSRHTDKGGEETHLRVGEQERAAGGSTERKRALSTTLRESDDLPALRSLARSLGTARSVRALVRLALRRRAATGVAAVVVARAVAAGRIAAAPASTALATAMFLFVLRALLLRATAALALFFVRAAAATAFMRLGVTLSLLLVLRGFATVLVADIATLCRGRLAAHAS